jgi:hypothetical protein
MKGYSVSTAMKEEKHQQDNGGISLAHTTIGTIACALKFRKYDKIRRP